MKKVKQKKKRANSVRCREEAAVPLQLDKLASRKGRVSKRWVSASSVDVILPRVAWGSMSRLYFQRDKPTTTALSKKVTKS